MRVLIVGGTQFVGRHIAGSLLAAGDELTLLHRGRTNPDLFPGATRLIADRDGDLTALGSGEWDATIDTSAYFPRQVRSLAEALESRSGHYVHISSVSAYAPPPGPGGDEDLPLAVLEDPATERADAASYGARKAASERATRETFARAPAGASIVRPTYVAGPLDHTGRFTWWVERVARGGAVLAPGPRHAPFQVIDVGDLADFVVLLAHERTGGTYHAVAPEPPFSFEDFLSTVVATVGPAGTELVWVDPQWLAGEGVTGRHLPLWAGAAGDADLSALDPTRATARGLRARPLARTVEQVHRAAKGSPTAPAGVGLEPDREAALLETWSRRPAGPIGQHGSGPGVRG